MMRKSTGTQKGTAYKAKAEMAGLRHEEVGGGHTTGDRKDSITLQEGRSPALTGAYSDWEGPVTAKGQSPRAQRTRKKVQVLQNKLHTAAKKDLKRTFGILYDKICWWEVLWTSWIRVQQNKGAPGVDGRTIEAIKEEGEVRFIRDIQRELVEHRYRPHPIRRVFIKKANGKLRPLGIPVVKDRVIQGAVKLILEPIFEANFNEESYGFRPRRSCQDALKSVRKWVMYGYSSVIDADIESYFDTVDHTILMELIRRRVRDKWILRLIRRWLECSIFDQDRAVLSARGTPQGAVLSPLLANIYLHPLDKYWAERHPETKLVRYADDVRILIRRRNPEPYLQSLKGFMGKLHLTLSEEKTRIVKAEEGFNFLGVRFVVKPTRQDRTRNWCYGFPTPESMNRIRQKIREEVCGDYEATLSEKIELINPILRGWANYYHWLNSGEHFHKVGRYVIQRLNRWMRRKQGRVKRSYRRLHGNELFERGLHRISGTIVHVS